MTTSLVPIHDDDQEANIDRRWQDMEGTAAPTGPLLSSPASDTPCVHWRLRITEALASNILVHDVASEEPFELQWLTDPTLPPARMPIDGRTARLDALAVVHNADSPGARAVAEGFGLVGVLRVEEILIRPGSRLEVQGMLMAEAVTSPYRAAHTQFPLAQVSIRVPGPLRRTSLLPWALGTGAALMSLLGAAGAVLRRMESAPSAKGFVDWVMHAEVGEPRPGYIRWP